MMSLLAQAVSTGEWYDGWQLAVVTFTALTMVVGWLHRQSKSDLKAVRDELGDLKTDLTAKITEVKTDLTADIAEVKADLSAEIVAAETRLKADIAEVKTDLKGDIADVKTDIASVDGDLKDLKDKLYDDALGKVAMYQWQLVATQPPASEAPSQQPQPQQSPPQSRQLAQTGTD